ncbi:hypothetical protein HBB16_12775 [Pseudonocardia sp. MCCB 268]|nr:hypothetical protein [Pseudonocardia cytotoxica]
MLSPLSKLLILLGSAIATPGSRTAVLHRVELRELVGITSTRGVVDEGASAR